MTIGERIRQARTSRHLPLSEVAARAKISVATLSRIERDKQGIDLDLFLALSRILKTRPEDLIGEPGAPGTEALAARIAAMHHGERLQLWKDLAERRQKARLRRHELSDQIEELIAQLEFVQSEIASVARNRRG